MSLKEDLQNALAEFGPDGEKWVNHCPMVDENCAVTSCFIVSGKSYDRRIEMVGALLAAIGEPRPLGLRVRTLVEWNDSSNWPEVKAVFEKAIAAAEEVHV